MIAAPSQNVDVHSVALICHAATPCRAVRRIDVDVCRTAATTLELRYRLEGDIDRLLIPAESAPRCADNLWQHTCFEAFVAEVSARGYWEFNFAPSTDWAIYRFSGYRERMTDVEAARAPQITVHRKGGALCLDAIVDLAPVHAQRDHPALQLALCAVIEEPDQRLSYWALAHPVGKPDFHHAAGFALALPGAGSFSPSQRGQ
jgi:hypothetical protein